MSDLAPGQLPPVEPGTGAFQETKVSGVPDVPVQTKEPTLDDILKAVQARNTETPADKPADKAADVPAVPASAEDKDKPAPAAVKPTGNKALDIAVQSFVKVAGATEDDISRALEQAYAAGDARLIDRAFLKERFGENSDQAIALAEAVMEYEIDAGQKLLAEVHALGGGEEQFSKAVALFKEHAPQGMQNVIRQMLDSNDADTVKEAASLIVEYGKSSGGLVQGAQRRIGDAGIADSQGLSYEQFTEARRKLNPMSRTHKQDLARLMDLRRIGKQLGK